MEKRILVQYDLDSRIFDEYGLEVYDIFPMRKVYLLDTNKGEKILKRVEYTLEDIGFLQEGLFYLSKNFSRALKIYKTKEGRDYVTFNGSAYVVLDSFKGVECDFTNPFHIDIASKGIAQMHKASKGIKTQYSSKDKIGKFITTIKGSLNDMKYFKIIAKKSSNKSEFDKLVDNCIDYYIDKAEESINYLKNSKYLQLCRSGENVVLCHNDLAYHNILIDENLAYFIDFDYALIDLRTRDLSNFINKVEKNLGFDKDKLNMVISSYNEEYKLSVDELHILYGMLLFPQDLFSICRNYYFENKEWNETTFVERLRNKLSTKDEREEFMVEFKKEYL